MKRNITLVLLTLLLLGSTSIFGQVERREEGNLVIEGIPEIPAQLSERMLQYQNTRSAVFQGWLNDGNGILISTRFGETGQIHQVAEPGAARSQLTFFEEPVSGASICPDETRNGFLFLKDIGGNEFYQLFYFNLDDGSSTMLTDGESRNGIAAWSNAGDRVAYYSTRRNGRDWDIYVMDIDKPEEAEMILSEGGVWAPVDWSADDAGIIVMNYVSANESYYYVLDLASGELVQVNPSEKTISYGGAVFTENGQGIYLVSDEDTEFSHLRYYNLTTGEQKLLSGSIPWDVGSIELSPEGDYLAFTVNEDGMRRLYMLDTATEEILVAPNIPIGLIFSLEFDETGDRLAMTLETPTSPYDVFVLDTRDEIVSKWATADETNLPQLTRWTTSEVGGLKKENFIVPELIHYPTFDEVDGEARKIPSFYYKPGGDGPFPVIISIHGGPESQESPDCSATYQYWLNELGVAILAPNVRGSTGYGKSYSKLDNGFKREESVKDIGMLIEWIKQQPELDNERICVFGGSYGGYMALSSMTHYNDDLACGIDIVGISNFVTFLENTKEYRQDLRRVEYGDERDPEMREFLMKISPTENVHKITKPLFVIQGLNDPRVPASEAEQILKAVRENGGKAWYLLAKDEGHGFRKKSNRDYYMNSVALFLEEFLVKK